MVKSGRLEAILEESDSSEEVAVFKCKDKEFMLVLRKPCIEFYNESE